MEIMGKKGLGSLLYKIMIIGFVFAIPTIIILPFCLKYANHILYSCFMIYPNGILLLGIILQFMKLFHSLEENNPFTMTNVVILKKTGYLSLAISIFWVFDLLLMVFVIHNHYINYILVLIFLILLFFGVFVALYILSELFLKATTYKEENDLTI